MVPVILEGEPWVTFWGPVREHCSFFDLTSIIRDLLAYWFCFLVGIDHIQSNLVNTRSPGLTENARIKRGLVLCGIHILSTEMHVCTVYGTYCMQYPSGNP